MQQARAGDVSEGVAADVAVVGGVGKFADANAIEDDPDDPRELRSALSHLSLPLIHAPRKSRLYPTRTSAAQKQRFCGLDCRAYNIWFTHMATEPIDKLPRKEADPKAVRTGTTASRDAAAGVPLP